MGVGPDAAACVGPAAESAAAVHGARRAGAGRREALVVGVARLVRVGGADVVGAFALLGGGHVSQEQWARDEERDGGKRDSLHDGVTNVTLVVRARAVVAVYEEAFDLELTGSGLFIVPDLPSGRRRRCSDDAYFLSGV